MITKLKNNSGKAAMGLIAFGALKGMTLYVLIPYMVLHGFQ